MAAGDKKNSGIQINLELTELMHSFMVSILDHRINVNNIDVSPDTVYLI